MADDSFQLLLHVQKVYRCLCLQEASKPENRAERPWIITMAHRPMYCSNAVGDGCENHENAVSNSSDVLLFEQLPVILIDLLVPGSNLLNLRSKYEMLGVIRLLQLLLLSIDLVLKITHYTKKR